MKTANQRRSGLICCALDNSLRHRHHLWRCDRNATGIGVPKQRRMSRPLSGYFFVRRHGTQFYGQAVRGSESCAGSFARYANPHGSALPDWRRGRRKIKTAAKEAIMPTRIRQALRAIFPLHAVPVSIVPTQAEARALGALLTSTGKRAVIYPAKTGFTVSEVAA